MTFPTSPRHLFRVLLLTVCFSLGLALAVFRPTPTLAQTDTADLFYRFNGEPIPLMVRDDAIAVAFQASATRTLDAPPLYQQLQNTLDSTRTRGDAVIVQPVGTQYAIVNLPAATSSSRSALRPQLALPYVETTLPVLQRADQDEQILLPNEIIISFAAQTSEAEQQQMLEAQGLELIRPLRFTENRVLARLKTVDHETAVLTAAEQLSQTTGVRSATPNFIPVRSPEERWDSELPLPSHSSLARSASDNRMNLAWHLDSTSMAPRLNNTGVNAPRDWALGNRGEGITVAVIDALIQWDHPALINNIYELPSGVEGLPEEYRGWDFTDNDPDTRVETAELNQLRPSFQDTFTLSDSDVLDRYRVWADDLKRNNPRASEAEIIAFIRNNIRRQVVGAFHGTTVAGVIGANAPEPSGLMGVAPGVKILPVRAGILFGGIPTVPAVEAIGYAAARGADVINLSWGSMMPTTAIADAIADVLAANPNLIIVASSGNDGENRVGFPAGLRHVISVGASTLQGTRAPYSSFGPGLTLVAPGGNVQTGLENGILTTSGTGNDLFWQNISLPEQPWAPAQDLKGDYVWAQGTSFASPAVAGVVALMLSADPQRSLNRDRLIALLESSSSHTSLSLAPQEQDLYSVLRDQSATPPTEHELQYFFGSGLVDAEAAVRLVQSGA
ncbi:S8 family serine peptidase [Leptolyngbya sp. CCY15150]|uniref:S8 family peptidase n=1 Tax=Leptolyngbya sp. CCY15150 TaxID=2767772 RepID=UPI0019518A4A|nr:S8 family serine peptidase [Leptolyngbya sp. CCY15150]